MKLPAAYREVVKKHNGGTPEPSALVNNSGELVADLALLFNIDSERMEKQLFAFTSPRETGFLPIGTNGGGDYFLLELESGEVLYWDHERNSVRFSKGDLTWLAESVPDLLEGLSYPAGQGPEVVDEIEGIGRSGSREALTEFLMHHSIDARSGRGRTVAEEAAMHGNVEVVVACVERGASPTRLLHYAAPGSSIELIEYLLGLGLDVNGVDQRGETPLDRALIERVYLRLEESGGVHSQRSRPAYFSRSP